MLRSKSAIWSISTSIIGILSGIVSQKLYALYLGASGITWISNINNMMVILLVFTTASQQNHIILLSSNAAIAKAAFQKILSSIFFYALLIGAIVCMAVVLLQDSLALELTGNSNNNNIILLVAFSAIVVGMNTLCLAILNGTQQIRSYSIVNIFIHLSGVLFRILAIPEYGLEAALVGTIIPNALSIILTLYFVRDYLTIFRLKFHIKSIRKIRLLQYLYMGVLSTLLLHASQLFFRSYLTDKLSATEAGYWQSVLSLSQIYMTIVITVMSTIYVPNLAKAIQSRTTKQYIHKEIKQFIPLVIIAFIVYFFLRKIVLLVAFSDEFTAASNYVLPVSIADFFRILSMMYAYITMLSGKTMLYTITELSFYAIYITLSLVLIDRFDALGISVAYSISYGFYFALYTYLFYFTKTLK